MLGLLLGFLVVVNLITLKRCWVMNTRLDLLVKLYAMPDILEPEKGELLSALIQTRVSIKFLLRLRKLLQSERYKSFTVDSQRYNRYFRTASLRYSRKHVH